jgi:hypothetical protein
MYFKVLVMKGYFLYCSYLQPRVSVPPEIGEEILGGKQKHFTSIKMKLKNLSNIEPALTLALTKILPRTEVLVCQKQVH